MDGDIQRFKAVALAALLLAGCATVPVEQATSDVAPEVVARDPDPVSSPPVQVDPVQVDPMQVEPAALDAAAMQRAERVRKAGQGLPRGDEGYYLDVLFAELRQRVGDASLVQREANAIRIVLPPSVRFDVASDRLTAEADAVLAAMFVSLADYRALLVQVHGHTDASGPDPVNRRLSAQRALTVARLLRRLGVSADQLLALGHGSDKPVADNASEAGRQANRRVELVLLPVVALP